MSLESQDVLIKKAINILKVAKCKYHIETESGEKFGEPINPPETKSNRNKKYEYGEIFGYIKPHLGEMSVGEVKEINVDRFGFNRLQSGVCNFMRKKYGSGNYITTREKTKNIIQVALVGQGESNDGKSI